MNFGEFLILIKNVWKESSPEELRNAIDVFDPTGNGYLTVDSLKNTLLNLGENLDEEDFKEFVKTINVQPDGTINTEGDYFKIFLIL